jgi:hypothetical protein
MNTSSLAHLHASVQTDALLEAPDRVRQLRRDRWIDYPRASQALQKLQQLLDTPPRERMPCLVLHGDSIGKSLIVAKFQKQHPTRFDAVKGVERRGSGGHADAGNARSAPVLFDLAV